MTEDTLSIEIDGRPFRARKGQMVIEVADANAIAIPRFCYHHKLTVAANCRMCLVEVERAPKPLPACATLVMDGMKVFTRSKTARAAQKSVMEFLLINHPLDCPICDQGGECELQDVSMGYGGDVSRFNERKRAVEDKDLGPLIATDMTRCIHCTRCVRFGEEIGGMPELGATGRGEDMEIGTFIAGSVDSELSGNVIDLCPVGALTSKPFRFRARAWEMVQRDGVAPHDPVGSNIHLHVRRGRVMRVVPRANEAINEVWISDRDRFGYEGLYSEDRVRSPMVRRGGTWREVSWEEALDAAAAGLREVVAERGGAALGALASASCMAEELCLFQHPRPRQRQRGSPRAPARLLRPGRGAGSSLHRNGAGGSRTARRGAADRLVPAQGASHRQPPAAQGEPCRSGGDVPRRDGPRPEPRACGADGGPAAVARGRAGRGHGGGGPDRRP